MGGSRSHSEFFLGKLSQNSPKPVIFLSSIPCVFCLYIAKSFGYYDLSVLSISVMGFQKKIWWVGGWGELYPNFFQIFGIKMFTIV